jgi:hypothetical protein
MKKLLITLLLIGCGSHKSSESVSFPAIEAKARLYCEQSKAEYQAKKWVVDECDGAGFTALYSLGCRTNEVDLSVFSGTSGEMFRNPSHDCYPDRSKSGFSKDHVLMRMVAAAGQHDKQWPRQFLDYVNNHGGVFCDAVDTTTKLSRCVISPFLYKYLNKLAGYIGLEDGNYSEDALFEKEGFEAHLQMLGIWLKGVVDGDLTNSDYKYIKIYSDREPLNALYQAIAFRYGYKTVDDVTKAFVNEHFPVDSLPTSANHCSNYLFQRDMKSTKDWEPCPERNEVYSGTDYTFAAYILTK